MGEFPKIRPHNWREVGTFVRCLAFLDFPLVEEGPDCAECPQLLPKGLQCLLSSALSLAGPGLRHLWVTAKFERDQGAGRRKLLLETPELLRE